MKKTRGRWKVGMMPPTKKVGEVAGCASTGIRVEDGEQTVN